MQPIKTQNQMGFNECFARPLLQTKSTTALNSNQPDVRCNGGTSRTATTAAAETGTHVCVGVAKFFLSLLAAPRELGTTSEHYFVQPTWFFQPAFAPF